MPVKDIYKWLDVIIVSAGIYVSDRELDLAKPGSWVRDTV